jgi:hypothetical protein
VAINAKVVMLFGIAKWGWAETYYYANGSGGMVDAVNAAKQLAGARQKMLSEQVTLEAIRISDMANKFATKFVPAAEIPGSQWRQPGPAAPVWLCLLGRLEAAATNGVIYRRPLLLRGLPSNLVTWDPNAPTATVFIPTLVNAFDAMVAILKRTTAGNPAGWSIRGNTRGAGSPDSSIVDTISLEAGTGRFEITAQPNPNFTVGQKVKVSGVRGPGTRGINGTSYVLKAVAGVYTLSARQKCPAFIAQITVPGRVRAAANSLVGITDGFPERFVKRDTGRPFFGTAGAQSSDKC